MGVCLWRDFLWRRDFRKIDLLILGVLLAGPIVCGMSQAANDWCDRHVDLINEPHRPIPSGRMPGLWGLWIALAMSAGALALGVDVRNWGFMPLWLQWPLHGPIPSNPFD